MRNKTRNVLALIASALLAGCQGHAVLPNQIDSERVARTDSIVLDVRMLDGELNVEYESRELNLSVPIAAVTAAQIAAMQTSRESAAAGGIIGAFVGVQIAKSAYRQRQQNLANEPAVALKTLVESADMHGHIEDAVTRQLAQSLHPDIRVLEAGPGSNNAPLMQLRARVRLSGDLASLQLRAELEMREQATGRQQRPAVAYAREIDYHDSPIADPHRFSPGELAAAWIADDGELFWERLNLSLAGLVDLVVRDLRGDLHAKVQGTGTAIRYANTRGTFYERGVLEERTEDRLLIRTLRNGLLSVPGQMVE